MPNVAETSAASTPPLTVLSEEERMFQDTVRRFARERISPYVREMDAAAAFRKDLLREMFELGLMGIEIPEEYGGSPRGRRPLGSRHR
jgi:alkylation response protein AidB-like acyl-CoA dehydrogenase